MNLTSDAFARLPRRTAHTPSVRLAAETHVGCVRNENQDYFHVDHEGAFMIVADGMGGHAGGKVASRIATAAAARVLEQHRGLARDEVRHVMRLAFEAANKALAHEAARRPKLAHMGTTLLCVARTADDELAIAHVGDSRLYRLRDGALAQLTRDHTMLNELLQQGMITPDKAIQNRHLSHVLTRSIGVSGRFWPDIALIQLQPGDRFLLASDGLYGALSPVAMGLAMGNSPSLTHCCDLLIRAAIRANASDNVTAVLVEIIDLHDA
ncbi:MAG: protein phosphatase 2C domain-containing protein [Myxococcota bacterium]